MTVSVSVNIDYFLKFLGGLWALEWASMNAEISETIKARGLGLGMQILGLPSQRKFVSAGCHVHSNAHNRP